jgi:hypothetical protein
MARRVSFTSLLLTILCALSSFADTILIPRGAVWKYLDNGSDQGTAWHASGFADGSWSSGPAQLGYGDGDEQTVVSFGTNPSDRYVTTYFRRAFNVVDRSEFSALTLKTLRDDGAVVYVNGTEVWRDNMPSGAVGYRTFAASDVKGAHERSFKSASISPALLLNGTNVIAVELHQVDASSSDLGFDLELIASSAQPTPSAITRGPYLQTGTPSSVRVRWRTDAATDSRVRYGTAVGALDQIADNLTQTTEHEVVVSGLSPSTTYYY